MISTTLTISRSLVFTSCYDSAFLLTWSWWHLQHGQWSDPQKTSLLRNDYWFLDHKETFIFTSKIFASVIGIWHWFESERSVSGSIPTGDRKWKLVPERMKLQGVRLQESMAHISDPVRYDHLTCPRDSWLATLDAVLLTFKHVPSQESNSVMNGCWWWFFF